MKRYLLPRAFCLCAAILIAVIVCVRANAQSDLTSVTGVIHDPSGAVVSNANVTIRNQATGAERKATTYYGGSYSITSVPAGAYTLIIEAPGFKRYEQANNTLENTSG